MSSKQSFTIQNTLGRQQENGRYASDVISQDLRRTGYWGGNADVSGVTGTEPPGAPAATCNTGDNTWARMIDQRIYGINHTETAALAAYACINDGNGHCITRCTGNALCVTLAGISNPHHQPAPD